MSKRTEHASRKFVGGSYELNTRDADVQRAVNLVPVMAEVAGAKSVSYLDSAPGLVAFSTQGFRVTEDGRHRFTEGGEMRLIN